MANTLPTPSYLRTQDLTGKQFGSWTVLEFAGRARDLGYAAGKNEHLWLCKCSCGKTRRVRGNHLRSGASTSCCRVCNGVPLADRFWSLVQKGSDCWEWQGRRFDDGYGSFYGRAHILRAHRLSYELTYGPIPEGMWVLHRCDNPLCVRPSHLFLGTNHDNVRDRIAKGRGVKGERSPNAKLNAAKVKEIRRLFAKGGWTYTSLGRKYSVTRATIRFIVLRKAWKHVP
jgi:hypothetical protein